jgi:lipoate-protein ligase A
MVEIQGEIICFDLTLPSVVENLALDEELLVAGDAGRGRPSLRFWEAADYTVVLGASRRVGDDVGADACRSDGVPLLRRSSGGGTVVLGPGALNLSVILPADWPPGLEAVDRAHRHVLEWIAASIRGAGRQVSVAGVGDLVLGDRKCGGSAQRRKKAWFMVHCSILYDFAIERIARYLTIPGRQPEYRAGRDHLDFLSNLGLPRKILAEAIAGGIPRCRWTGEPPFWRQSELDQLVAEKFANPAWIERF